jgi:uncharacterized protein YbaP (TraB family)
MKIKLLAISFFLLSLIAQSQIANKPKYNSLLWEITNKNSQKKSYLFGTMHVSNKLAFNLSDSFYNALKLVDAVALENDPSTWQEDFQNSLMTRLDLIYSINSNKESDDFITQKSFQFSYSENPLKIALSSDPEMINQFLYRSYSTSADFEENTFLDMHIYQCAKKMGKLFYGLEKFKESENLLLKAYKAEAAESKKKSKSTEAEEEVKTNNETSLLEKIQDAYRKGNLNLLDSLSLKDMQSEGFREYFLYKRNEIHANEITKIISQNKSVFAAVGAMHLAGKRGVIELLRKQGYIVKPITMGIQMSKKRDEINKIKVPKTLSKQFTIDSLFTVNTPGKLYNFTYASAIKSKQWVCADFDNGAYYMVSRIATQGIFWGFDTEKMTSKIDSILYENIPGKIIEKNAITTNYFKGFSILNKTSKGDFQRYQIYITPLELIVFKMSGFEEYVKGVEGNEFFASIKFNKPVENWVEFKPNEGGYKILTPHNPVTNNGNMVANTNDYMGFGSEKAKGLEAYDAVSKTYCFMLHKKIINYNVLEEDTFSMALAMESFNTTKQFLAPNSQKKGTVNGLNYLEQIGKCVDGNNYTNRLYLDGYNYYLLIAKYPTKNDGAKKFLESFSRVDYATNTARLYVDSLLCFKVNSSLSFDSLGLDFIEMSRIRKKTTAADDKTSKTEEIYNKPEEKLSFKNDTTREEIMVISTPYSKYDYYKDSTKFWNGLINNMNVKVNNKIDEFEFEVSSKKYSYPNNTRVLEVVYTDTNCTQNVYFKFILNKGRLFSIYTVNSNLYPMSGNKKQFFDSFEPLNDSTTNFDLFESKAQIFLNEFLSKDSTINKFARKNRKEANFNEKDLPIIIASINKLNAKDKNYLEDKESLIDILGSLKADTSVASLLKNIYNKAADTSTFQNQAILSLAQLQTQKSFGYLSEIFSADPPIFQDEDETQNLFNYFSDTLALAKQMLPSLLPLANLEDYKWSVYDLIIELTDSGFIKANDYESLYNTIFFEAKIQYKKLAISDEKLINKTKDEDGNLDDDKTYTNFYTLKKYAKLLMPFWNSNSQILPYFNKLLSSKNNSLKLDIAKVMDKNEKIVADSIWQNIASEEKQRLDLYDYLVLAKKTNKFPKTYLVQSSIVKSILNTGYDKKDSLVYLNKYLPITLKNNIGNVHFFKYKNEENDADWNIAFGGVQPSNINEINTNDDIKEFTSKVLKTNQTVDTQIKKILKEKVYELRKSSSKFFDNSSNVGGF